MFARRDMVDDKSPELHLRPLEQAFDEDFEIIEYALACELCGECN